MALYALAWITLITLHSSHMVLGTVEFKGIECITADKSVSEFDYCFMKTDDQTKHFSVKIDLFKSISNLTVNIMLMRKEKIFKPYTYNLTIDGCTFMKSRRHSLVKFLFDFLERFSNINHTCPYNHEIIIDKMSEQYMNSRMKKIFMPPTGHYGLNVRFMPFNKLSSKIIFYGQVL